MSKREEHVAYLGLWGDIVPFFGCQAAGAEGNFSPVCGGCRKTCWQAKAPAPISPQQPLLGFKTGRVGNPPQDGILPHLQFDGYGFYFGVLLQAVFA
jgi:hypothetical protein